MPLSMVRESNKPVRSPAVAFIMKAVFSAVFVVQTGALAHETRGAIPTGRCSLTIYRSQD